MEERPFMAAFDAIMITGELQLVSFGFETPGAKAPFIPTPYAALKRRSSTKATLTVVLSSHSIKPVPLPEASPVRVPGPLTGRSRSPPPRAFRRHRQSPPSGQRPSRNFHAKL